MKTSKFFSAKRNSRSCSIWAAPELIVTAFGCLLSGISTAQELPALKQQLSTGVDSRTKLVKEMVDSIFSFCRTRILRVSNI